MIGHESTLGAEGGARRGQKTYERSGDADLSSGGGKVLLSTTEIGIVAVDDKGIIRSCNKAAERLLGRDRHDLIGLPLGFPTAVDEEARIDVLLPGGDVRQVGMRVSQSTWDDMPIYVTALHDLSRPYQPTVEELEANLEHQSAALAVTAHDMNEPLVGIKLAADRLRSKGPSLSGQSCQELLDRIDESTRYLQSLVAKVRTATSIDARKTRPAEPVHVFPNLLQRLHVLNQPSEEVNIYCDPGTMVLVSRTDFAEMIDNYLTNARTYGRPPIDIHVTRRGDSVEIRIRDSGPGVADDFVPHLFERFRQATSSRYSGSGTGLGLWIVSSLARANRGKAWYEGGRPGGACFCISLPAHDDGERVAESSASTNQT